MERIGILNGVNLNRPLDRVVLTGNFDRRILFSGRRIPYRVRSIPMAVSGAMPAISPRKMNLELNLFGDRSRDQNSENRESGVSCNYEKLDGWIRESVTEIVKNLKKAPLLVNVYADGVGRGTRLETAEEWPAAKRKWENECCPAPDGVIFVEELREDSDEVVDSPTKAWGVVVQGRGSDCPPACYLLKTSGHRGLGLCCTHFCLVKVSSFRETASSQLRNCWLKPPLQ